MPKNLKETYHDLIKPNKSNSKMILRKENTKLLKESVALRKDSLSVFKQILESKENVARQIAEHAPKAIEVLIEIMGNEDVSPQTRALIAMGIVDRVGLSTHQVNKELERQHDSGNNPAEMSLADVSKMLDRVKDKIASAQVIDQEAIDITEA